MPHRSLTFAQLGLSAPLVRALEDKKYPHPSPIQAEAIPHLLAGRDLLGSAQTGTGKTAAFALPILQRLSTPPAAGAPPVHRVARSPRALILTPTRELAVQIGESFAAYGRHLRLRHVVIFGGVGQNPQVRGAHDADIVVATPGRLLDLVHQGHVRFDRVEIFVLDEADRMLDMGFAPDIKRILGRLPQQRQSLLFSATMPPSILDLAGRVVRNPVRVAVTPEAPTAERVEQRLYHVEHGKKYPLLRHVLEQHPAGLTLVFMRTKHGANKLAKNLGRDGFPAEAIHGNKSQNARQRALETFRTGRVQILVATDVAARGIDVKGISLVINYDIPNEPEAYVHRIGRTARAGAEGIAISFCEPSERAYLRDIQRLIRQTIPVQTDLPENLAEAPKPRTRHIAERMAAQAHPPHAPAHGHGHSSHGHGRPAHPHERPQHSPAHAPAHSGHAAPDAQQPPRQHEGTMVTGYGHRGQSSGHRPHSGFKGGFHRQRRGGHRQRSWGR